MSLFLSLPLPLTQWRTMQNERAQKVCRSLGVKKCRHSPRPCHRRAREVQLSQFVWQRGRISLRIWNNNKESVNLLWRDSGTLVKKKKIFEDKRQQFRTDQYWHWATWSVSGFFFVTFIRSRWWIERGARKFRHSTDYFPGSGAAILWHRQSGGEQLLWSAAGIDNLRLLTWSPGQRGRSNSAKLPNRSTGVCRRHFKASVSHWHVNMSATKPNAHKSWII